MLLCEASRIIFSFKVAGSPIHLFKERKTTTTTNLLTDKIPQNGVPSAPRHIFGSDCGQITEYKSPGSSKWTSAQYRNAL